MTEPFVLFSLPRSRTYWTSQFLASGCQIGHDTLVECNDLNQFVDQFDGAWNFLGTVETAAIQGWQAIRAKRPGLRFAILHRPVEQVLTSLRALGTPFDELEIRKRYIQLGNLAATGVPVWQAEGLSAAPYAKSLVDWATGNWDGERFNSFVNTNLQINWQKRMELLASRRTVFAKLKAETLAYELTLPPVIAEEGWATVAEEVYILGKAHFDEVNKDLPSRTFCPDQRLLQACSDSGALRGMVARRGGHLVGYSAWNIAPDAECVGQLEARQGPWYCTPEAGHGTALKLFDASLDMLRKLGVQVCYPHHHFSGRGAKLEKFYRAAGAVPAMNVYQLWLGDRSNG